MRRPNQTNLETKTQTLTYHPTTPMPTPTLPKTMAAVHLTHHGGFDALHYREDLPLPTPKPDQVLIRVAAAGINNTDINTRIGWYSKSVTAATDNPQSKSGSARTGIADLNPQDASWSGTPLHFPRIQGADCCGYIIAHGAKLPAKTRANLPLGQRVLVRPMMQDPAHPNHCITFGSECDGSFAQYTVAPAAETFPVNCKWSDAELASIPCAYSTAEGMLHRASVGGIGNTSKSERVLITGASGGVGSAAIQLAQLRNAQIIALAGDRQTPAGREKIKQVAALLNQNNSTKTHQVLPRNADLPAELGADSIDVVVDLVAGETWSALLEVLKRGGRYVTSGAIAGPIVQLDIRTLYLKDLTLFGSTFQPRIVFENLIRAIERNAIKPLLAATYPLADIKRAQQDFLAKKYVGKLVLLPPAPSD